MSCTSHDFVLDSQRLDEPLRQAVCAGQREPPDHTWRIPFTDQLTKNWRTRDMGESENHLS